jgi:hypothetical protein
VVISPLDSASPADINSTGRCCQGLWGARATGKDAAKSAGINSTTSVPLDAARATGKDAASSAGVNSTTGVPLDAARATGKDAASAHHKGV